MKDKDPDEEKPKPKGKVRHALLNSLICPD